MTHYDISICVQEEITKRERGRAHTQQDWTTTTTNDNKRIYLMFCHLSIVRHRHHHHHCVSLRKYSCETVQSSFGCVWSVSKSVWSSVTATLTLDYIANTFQLRYFIGAPCHKTQSGVYIYLTWQTTSRKIRKMNYFVSNREITLLL